MIQAAEAVSRVVGVSDTVRALSDLPAIEEPFTLITDSDPVGINREGGGLRPIRAPQIRRNAAVEGGNLRSDTYGGV